MSQERTPISAKTISEVRKLGSRSKDISFVGPYVNSGQIVIETREAATGFDDKTLRVIEVPKYSTAVFDDTSLKQIRQIDKHGELSSVSKDGKKFLWRQRLGFAIEGKDLAGRTIEGFRASVSGSSFHPKKEFVAVNVWECDPGEVGCLVGYSNIRLYTMNGMLLHRFANEAGGASSLEFSPDGNLLAVVNQNTKKIELLDMVARVKLRTMPTNEKTVAIKFHPDGKRISVLTASKVKVYNAEKGKLIHEKNHGSQIVSGGMQWSVDGELLIVAKNGKLTFLDSKTLSNLREVKLFYRGVTEFLMTPDGSRIIVETKCLDKWNPKARMVESWGVK